MAIAKMKKVFLLAHQSVREELVDFLQEKGLLHIQRVAPEETAVPENEYQKEAERIELLLSKIRYVLDFLTPYEVKREAFLGLVRPKIVINWSQFMGIEEKTEFEEIYNRCEELSDQMAEREKKIKELTHEKIRLKPFELLEVPLAEAKETNTCKIVLGEVGRQSYAGFKEELESNFPETELQVISEEPGVIYLILIYHKALGATLQDLFRRRGFSLISFPEINRKSREELQRIDREINRFEEEFRLLKGEAQSMAKYLPDLLVLYEFLENKRRRAEVQSSFNETESVFLLHGWLEATRVDSFQKEIAALSEILDVTITEPEPEDKPPIVLKNPSIVKPFEVLTQLYGMPSYREQDPTPFIALFFFLFFGIAIGDFGYGLVLALFCAFLKRRIPITEIGRRWLNLFILGGISSMIVGIPTGGYFGIEISALPVLLRNLVILDPLKEAFLFLIFTWALGVIHIFVGLLIEFIDGLRNKSLAEAFFDQFTTIAFFSSAVAALSGWLILILFKGGVFWKGFLAVSVQFLLFTAASVVIFQGRFFSHYLQVFASFWRKIKGKNRGVFSEEIPALLLLLLLISFILPVKGFTFAFPLGVFVLGVGLVVSSPTRQALAKLGSGLYKLYSMTGFIGDMLSYSRLMALGLATVLIGFVVNILVKLVWSISPAGIPIGLILAVVMAVMGHGANLLINLLGAFVHPLRLQFVEFFKYFYEDGGENFRPFAFETKNLILKE